MAKLDPQILAHLEWLGFVRPTGLVVSAPALVRAGAILDRRDGEGQQLLRDRVAERVFRDREGPQPYIPDFRTFATFVLGWSFSPKGYAGTTESPIPAELELPLPEYSETLRPDYAVRELEPKEGAKPWQLLVKVLEPGEDLDQVPRGSGRLEASEHSRMERLLRETRVPAGLLFNGRTIRIVSAPRGESSGWMDFRVADMFQTAGRPISTAMRMLLGQSRLLSLPRAQRFSALLEDSRKFQNEVSERLAEQVLHALYELLRGFQAAHDASKGELLRAHLADDPSEVYRALLTVILRLVFLLYAEERDMLPEDETFLRHYSLAGLYERLREDAALFPDTMDQRYGAWAQLLALFRMVHDGAQAGALKIPRRRGALFDPDRFKFLEGRSGAGVRQLGERIDPPLVPDGTVYRALEKLLVLGGERISYRALDVEQIGSVYETMMGFRLETATGRSVAVRAQKKQGAPTTIDLEALLEVPAVKRDKWIADAADRELSESVKRAVAAAQSLEDLHAALRPVIDEAATPDLVPRGAAVLQPSEERRRSGSHYTPRALTEPIVRTTLEPVLARLKGESGRPPRPAQILDIKVCDPAMGSGAFLVEACRQLGDVLVEAWHAHGEVPAIPTDETELVFARRLVAQRCLYGVDRNPVAVDLAKVSLWLITLAKDHPLTFLDHALRHGDSLVGVTRKQIEAFHWEPTGAVLTGLNVREPLDRCFARRRQIREARDDVSDLDLRGLWEDAQRELDQVRLIGDLVVAAYFSGEKPRAREAKRVAYASDVLSGRAELHSEQLRQWREKEKPLVPFHWDIEFPEVFGRENPGFDVFVGNPPFMGGSKISSALGDEYLAWVLELHEEAHGNGDLVAHFFRRAFNLLRRNGALGLIATNTIAQGDTRSTGLRWISSHGGEIYAAFKRVKWPGLAAVVVSVVHLTRGEFSGLRSLDDRKVEKITAFLFHRGGNSDPARLAANAGLSCMGCKVSGPGFLFDDSDRVGGSSSIEDMRKLLARAPRCDEVIFPYLAGDELNSSPVHAHGRYAINFGARGEAECRRRWPEAMTLLEQKVKPDRLAGRLAGSPWWLYERSRPDLYDALANKRRALVISAIGQHAAFTFLPSRTVFSHALIVFPSETDAAFCALQSRPHEIWARFFGSSMKDDLRYTPSDCFETFPFPDNWQTHPALETAGKAYYEFRAALMVRNGEGLTKTYNRFHDPDEPDPEIAKLRELHAAMDRAVLVAYGWPDIPTECKFLLDYEIDEEWGDKKKPYRLRWRDEVRDEVLARLLELNARRAAEEARSGAAAGATGKRKGSKRSAKKSNESGTGDFFS